jgi:(E)-4-hydroxy-3-methylbut-2-enyl-diphosphate synthase
MFQDSKAVFVLLDVAEGVSRVHASRRFFELLRFYDIDLPVIHTRRFPAGTSSIIRKIVM